MAPRETENDAYAKFWVYKQIALWYAMVFSGVVNCISLLLCFVLFFSNRLLLFNLVSAPSLYLSP